MTIGFSTKSNRGKGSMDSCFIEKSVDSKELHPFDIYHQQISEGNIINNILANIDYIGHFHAAGHPGRHELQHGEINYPEIFSAIKQTNFSGYIGLEYWPLTDNTTESLQEVVRWLE